MNIKLDSGWTPLMHACFHAQDKIVKYLLDMGADPNLHSGEEVFQLPCRYIQDCIDDIVALMFILLLPNVMSVVGSNTTHIIKYNH